MDACSFGTLRSYLMLEAIEARLSRAEGELEAAARGALPHRHACAPLSKRSLRTMGLADEESGAAVKGEHSERQNAISWMMWSGGVIRCHVFCGVA